LEDDGAEAVSAILLQLLIALESALRTIETMSELCPAAFLVHFLD
jgi:hypothetical protein